MVIYGLLWNDLKGKDRNLVEVVEEENNRNVVVIRDGGRKYRNVVMVEKENNRNVMGVMEKENNRNVVVVKEGRTRSKPI